jgi:lysophospholipase L1-like esterase
MLHRLLMSAAALTLGLLGQAGCNSEPEPSADVAGNDSQAGSVSTPNDGGRGGAVGGSGTPTNSAGRDGAGSSGQANAAAGTGGSSSMAGAGAAGAATAGNPSGGISSSAGTGGGAGAATGGGAGTGGSTGDGTKPIKVWLAGDSTVQNCSGTCPCGWGSQLDALFNDNVTVVNSAVGGRSVQTWLYEASVSSTLGQDGECTLTSQSYDKRWTAMLDATTGMKAGDYLFIQFGINDSDSKCPKHVGIPRFKTLLATMAQAAKERGAQPVFVTPVSAIICSGNTAQPTRGRFVTATEEAATASGVPLLDLHQLSIDLYNQLGFCPNDENYGAGKVGSFFCQDHTHFEASGAKQVASLVAGALAGAAPTLAKYRK